jgi:hypothetical protein
MDLSKRLTQLRHQRQQIIAAIRALELVVSSRGKMEPAAPLEKRKAMLRPAGGLGT